MWPASHQCRHTPDFLHILSHTPQTHRSWLLSAPPSHHRRTFAQSGTCPYGTRCRFIHPSSPDSPAGVGSATPSVNGASTPPAPSRVRRFAAWDALRLAGMLLQEWAARTAMLLHLVIPLPCRCMPHLPRSMPFAPSRPLLPPPLIPRHPPTLMPPPQDASYSSLSALGGAVASPATPPLAAYAPATPSPSAPGLLPGATVPAHPAGLAGLHGLGLGAANIDAGTLAALLSLQGTATAGYSASPALGGYSTPGYSTPTAAASPYAQAAAFGQAYSPASNSGVLEALTALLGGHSAPSPVASPPLTAAAGALGVVGPPAGLSPIGTTTAASRLGALPAVLPANLQAAAIQGHFPSAPGTPAGPACAPAMRRSISGEGQLALGRVEWCTACVVVTSWHAFQHLRPGT